MHLTQVFFNNFFKIIAMRFYAQKAMEQKIVEINHKLSLIIVYQRIYFPLFDI